jgi:hypothetical protein
MSRESSLSEYVKILQAVARSGLLRREKDEKFVKKIISK